MTNTRTPRPGTRPAGPDWRKRTTPVRLEEITDAMLEPIIRQQQVNGLPQTVFPSRYFGPDFQGTDCLLVSAAAILLDWEPAESIRPESAAESAMPLITLLPPGWYPPIESFPGGLVVTEIPGWGTICTGCGRRPKEGAIACRDQHGGCWCRGCVFRMREAGLLPAANAAQDT
jgi:hypothetical protein